LQIGIPREADGSETRVAVSPEAVARLTKKEGAKVLIESGLGEKCRWSDEEYREKGAEVAPNRTSLLEGSDLILRVGMPPKEEIGAMQKGAVHISHLDPFNRRDLVEAFREADVSAISMELVPRSTRAQKMDSLSSQHSLAGYVMVLVGADLLDRVLPMMITPCGTVGPARVFVIGAGVAGLQAIATAKRLGARVEAFDTRPVVKEQVESLGARFVEIDLGDTGQTEQGYAKELTEEQKRLQLEGMKKFCRLADLVITTAKLFGRPAPRVVTREMLEGMRPGSVVIDYAAESGGNVEGSKPGEVVEIGGVRVVGFTNFPGRVAADASRMYANNLYNMIDEFWDEESGRMKIDLEDEILRDCLVAHQGEIVSPIVRKVLGIEEAAS